MAIKFSDIFNANDINMNNQKLEEVLSKTKTVAETFGKKSAEHLEVSRKKVEILDAKTKLSRAYEKYGEMQYNALIGIEPNQQMLDDTAVKISQYREKIALLSEEVERAKAEFNEAVATATKKTRDAFQKEFDKMNKNEITIEPQNEENV